MKIYVRGQDGDILEQVMCLRFSKNNTNNKYSIKGYYSSGDFWIIGQYRSKKRCKEILDDIQYYIRELSDKDLKSFIYVMPKE